MANAVLAPLSVPPAALPPCASNACLTTLSTAVDSASPTASGLAHPASPPTLLPAPVVWPATLLQSPPTPATLQLPAPGESAIPAHWEPSSIRMSASTAPLPTVPGVRLRPYPPATTACQDST